VHLACTAHAKTVCPNRWLHYVDCGIGNWIGVEAMIYALIAVLIAQAVYTYVVAGGSHENSD
jgi:hypothetical protein